MKLTLLVLTVFFCSLFSFNAQAQLDVTIGTGTATNTGTTYPCPLQDFYEGSRAQYLYRASELLAAGMVPGNVTAIKFNVTSLGTFTGTVEQMAIKITSTTATGLTATTWETVPATNVYGPTDYVPTVGINTFNLSTPFVWNGSSNILIEICNGDPNNGTAGVTTFTSNPFVTWTTGLAFNGSHSYRADNLGNLCGTATTTENGTPTTRPNIIFSYTPASACSGTPVAGTAISTTTNITCLGAPFTLSLTGATIAGGITVQWQSASSPTGPWSNITGATTFGYTTTQLAAVLYYRAVVTCNGTNSANSAAVQVNSVSTPPYAPLPYNEGFENTWLNSCSIGDIPAANWKNTPATGNTSWRRYDDFTNGGWTSNNGAYTPPGSVGVNSARFHSYDATSGTSGTLDVYLNCNTPAATKRIRFDYINISGSDSLSVLISTDGGTTFVRYDSAGIATAWRTKTIYFNSTSATTIVRFMATGDFGVTDIGIDNLGISNYDNCSGTPTGGTTVSSQSTICLNSQFLLSTTGSTDANGLTYQWQSSTDGITWVNIPGATGETYNAQQAVSTYYRRLTNCTFSSASAPSTAVQVTSPPLVAGTFTINSAAPAGGGNFQSFNTAYDYIKCGINGPIVFNVNATSGPYNEQLIMIPVPGASAANTVTFNGNGRTIKYSSTNTNERAVIKLNNADHIRFDSLVIDATAIGTGTTYGYGVQFINNADSNVVRRCTINTAVNSTSTNYAGIVLNASATSATTTGDTFCDSNYVAQNRINGGYYSITTVGSTTQAVQRNVIVNNTIRDFYFYGIYVSNTFLELIEGNDISRPTATTVSSFYGIYATGLSVSMQISKNRIYNPFDGAPTSTSGAYGIYFTAVDALAGFENRVVNNLIYNINGAGVAYGLYNSSSDNVLYHHNTISLDLAASTSTNVSRGFYQTLQADGIELINNIISIQKGGTGQKHAVYLATATSTYTANNNDYLVNIANAGFIGFTGTANQATLVGWQTATGQDAASLAIDPLYTSVATANYQPTAAIIDNQGQNLGVLTDIVNAPRTATPDPGAYEFTAPGCAGTVAAGSAISSSDTVCVGTLFSLGTTGTTNANGITYQWQSSPDGVTWTNIPGATRPVLNTTQNATSFYRLIINCTASASISTSTVKRVFSPALVSGTFTINSAAPAGSGNFQSFNTAYDYLKCGINGAVVFNVNATSGPYNEQLIMAEVPGASAANTVTFNGNGRTIKFNSANTDERAVIKFNGADHIRLDSLVIDATGGTYGYGVQFINNADSNVLRRSTINTALNTTSTSFAGIVMSASATSPTTTGATLCDSNYIAGNRISGGYYGITTLGSTAATLQRNVLLNNTIRDFYFYGIYTSYVTNMLIEGNDISRPAATTVSSFYGIYAASGANALSISKNRLHNPFDGAATSTGTFYGIYLSGVTADNGMENKITNNIIYNVNGQGSLYALYNSASDNAQYYHNTISLDNTASTASNVYVTRGFYQITQSAGIVFTNNIISISRGGASIKHAIYLGTNTTSFTATRNDYYVNAGAGANYVGYYSTNQTTLTDWQTATGQDAASVSQNPQYTAPATGNLTPRNIVLDNRGLAVGITTDILNATRSLTAPDIGAFEFSFPLCTSPPAAGASVAVPNVSICMGTPVDLSLPNASIGSSLTVQWQYSASTSGPWNNLGNPLPFADTTIRATTTLYYRALVTCSGNTTTSTPVLVTVKQALLSGFYTINPALPVSITNFQNFASAVFAMECGITGFVTFDVSPGIYNEQIRMRSINGAGLNSRVTFRSLSGVPSSVTLTSGAATPAANYVLQLDSASYITYKNMSITGTNTTSGRVVGMLNTASYDSIVNCTITAPTSASTSNTIAGIHADSLIGSNNVIKANRILNGTNGIYMAGFAATPNRLNVIDSNTVDGAYYYGIYTSYSNRLRVSNNTVNTTAPLNTSAYSIYGNYCDTAYQFTGNNLNISNATSTVYGMYLNYCEAALATIGRVANNKIQAITGLSGSTYGLYQNYTNFNYTVNNAINVKTTGTTAYGIYSNYDDNTNYWNNTVHNTSTTVAATNAAAYFNHTTIGSGSNDIRNNIFSGGTAARALTVSDPSFIYSDYNLLYTGGAILTSTTVPAATYPTLAAWKTATSQDYNSLVFRPAFISDADLRPNVADTNVWAIHGRGEQIVANNADINNAPRPTTLQAGVPDLGAYEFLPTSIPLRLVATPALPAAGTTQTFMLGTDTVTKITWPGSGAIPPSIVLRRYSGVPPAGITPATPYMYFYVDADSINGGSFYNAVVRQYYIDPWQGFIGNQANTRMGKTLIGNVWTVNPQSTVNTGFNFITDTSVTYLDKFTGLTNGIIVPPPQVIAYGDSSNRGTEFWVGYGHHQYFGSDNTQDMILYLSAEQPANVVVKINGTTWERSYFVPGNSVTTTITIPKFGPADARLLIDGKSDRGINITSDVPIVAYAHIYGTTSSSATLLLPVGTYGYEYSAITSKQNYANNTYSWTYAIAAYDSTVIQITPSNLTLSGRPANVPFTVTLNKGEVYQVLGAISSGSDGYDMTGTRIVSIPNPQGRCFPIAVFSGSSRTNINCSGSNVTGSGDNLIQQNFPTQAWGRRYLVAPTSNSTAANSLMTNIYRIVVKDPTTVVSINGVAVPTSTLINNLYYQYESNTADYITADKPITVAQYMSSGGGCGNTTGNGDPEMIYLSPLEQGIKRMGLYRTTRNTIVNQYLTIIIPTAGVASLIIDGSSAFDYTYPVFSLPGYTVVVKRWATAGNAQVIASSDSAFTAITYGLGSAESYGYNAGTLVKNLNAQSYVNNTLNSVGNTSQFTCAKAPFRVSILLPLRPTQIVWNFSALSNITPNANVTQVNPIPIDSVVVNGSLYYRYTVNQDYIINPGGGTFYVPVTYTSPTIEGCSNSITYQLPIVVRPVPVADFTAVPPIACVGSPIQFNGPAATSVAGYTINRWNWTFPDTTASTLQNVSKAFATPGVKNIALRIVTVEGCIGDTVKTVTINPLPTLSLVRDTLTICPGSAADTLRVQSPVSGVTYTWYTVATGGTPVFTGANFPVTTTGVYYAQATSAAGCVSAPRRQAIVNVYAPLATPVASVDSAGVNFIRFRWNAVPGAVSYSVSIDGGTTFITPSSGATGLTHTVSPLLPLTSATLIVRVNGLVSCQTSVSAQVSGRTLPDQIYIPNVFTPNGDGRNDIWLVYGYTIRNMQVSIFNQWGQKIFESSDQRIGWDGSYKGQQQPVGVYVYVIRMTLNDGTTMDKKGAINLAR